MTGWTAHFKSTANLISVALKIDLQSESELSLCKRTDEILEDFFLCIIIIIFIIIIIIINMEPKRCLDGYPICQNMSLIGQIHKTEGLNFFLANPNFLLFEKGQHEKGANMLKM